MHDRVMRENNFNSDAAPVPPRSSNRPTLAEVRLEFSQHGDLSCATSESTSSNPCHLQIQNAQVKEQYRRAQAAQQKPDDVVQFMFAPKSNVSAAPVAAVASSDETSSVAERIASRPSSLVANAPAAVAAPPPLESIAVGPSSAGFFVPFHETPALAPLPSAAAPLPPFDFGAMAAVQRQIGRVSPLDAAELVSASEPSANSAVALSEHEALGLRIEATRAQCEECFGAALFERVYRALRDASDAQNRTVDDLQVRCELRAFHVFFCENEFIVCIALIGTALNCRDSPSSKRTWAECPSRCFRLFATCAS